MQVEHTITEEITDVDIVRCQLLLAQGVSIEDLNLPTQIDPSATPRQHAIQLRITAEDATKSFTLSMDRVTGFQAPTGPGVRVETQLGTTKPTTVGSSYDSLLAKLVLRSSTFEETRMKALRALSDTVVSGITTNLDVLAGIVSSLAFEQASCSTNWLEANLDDIITTGKELQTQHSLAFREQNIASSTTTTTSDTTLTTTAGLGNSGILFRKGDAFKLELTDSGRTNDKTAKREEYLLRIDRVSANNFPAQLTADVIFSTAASSQSYSMNLTSTTQTSVASSHHRMASSENATHIGLPFPGQFVELLVDEGDKVQEGEVLCVVQQMKMELEVRAPWPGTVKWVCDVADGETVNEGLLVCELEPADEKSIRKRTNAFKL